MYIYIYIHISQNMFTFVYVCVCVHFSTYVVVPWHVAILGGHTFLSAAPLGRAEFHGCRLGKKENCKPSEFQGSAWRCGETAQKDIVQALSEGMLLIIIEPLKDFKEHCLVKGCWKIRARKSHGVFRWQPP